MEKISLKRKDLKRPTFIEDVELDPQGIIPVLYRIYINPKGGEF